MKKKQEAILNMNYIFQKLLQKSYFMNHKKKSKIPIPLTAYIKK